MKKLLGSLLLLSALAAPARESASTSIHRGFLRQAGTKCFLEDANAPIEERRLSLDGALCEAFPQWRGLYLQVKGAPTKCHGSGESKCLLITDARPTLYDPLGQN